LNTVILADLATRRNRQSYTLSPFIGSWTELSELGHAMDALLSGDGGMFVLDGEPGIGKTRLAREFANGASSWGVRAL
jgi:MoxR-like ATPase